MASIHAADDFKTINHRMKDLEREATQGLPRKGPPATPVPFSPSSTSPTHLADDFKTISQRMKGLEHERAQALSRPIPAPSLDRPRHPEWLRR